MIDNREVGRKIASMRQSAGLTQQQLASSMNVSHQAVSKWESGQALPDIQTMQSLTRFFGITVDQLIAEPEPEIEESVYEATETADTIEEYEAKPDSEKEKTNMSIQQLLQMAPYMSKETVEEIVLEIDEKITAGQIARIAPYIRSEAVEKLMEKHQPEISWESLKRIAPYLSREYVDHLARESAGKAETSKQTSENINKAFNEIGKAIDDVGREMGHAVKKGLRFGKRVIREVSNAICDLGSEDSHTEPAEPVRSERVLALRKKAFERAAADGKWDWLAAHMDELENDPQLRTEIAEKAREAGMHDWICENMGGYVDITTIEAAIEAGNWSWLGENCWQLEKEYQEKVVRAAVERENWSWLNSCSDRLLMKDCGLEVACAALKAGERELAARIAENHLLPEENAVLARNALESGDTEALAMLLVLANDEAIDSILLELARREDWEQVKQYIHLAGSETVEGMMELAVEQGNFDAVDLLDAYL